MCVIIKMREWERARRGQGGLPRRTRLKPGADVVGFERIGVVAERIVRKE